jgi:general secretion pathway protein H
MVVRAHSHACRSHGFANGFTLVEILVVVLLLGVTVAFVAVNLGSDDREILRGEAARLAMGLEQAQDEVVMTGVALAWRGGADGYQFVRRGADGGWTSLDGEDAFPPRRLALPVRLVDVEVGGVKVAAGALVVLSPSALAAPVRIVLEANSERAAVEVGATTRVVMGSGV